MMNPAEIEVAVKSAKSVLRKVPKFARNAHHQMAKRCADDADLLKDRNQTVATEYIRRAQFHIQFI